MDSKTQLVYDKLYEATMKGATSLEEEAQYLAPIFFPKRTMEINGIANIMLLIPQIQFTLDEVPRQTSGHDAFDKLKVELEMLERYMLAYHKSVIEGTPNPMWHEVKANPHLYPTNNEKAPFKP